MSCLVLVTKEDPYDKIRQAGLRVENLSETTYNTKDYFLYERKRKGEEKFFRSLTSIPREQEITSAEFDTLLSSDSWNKTTLRVFDCGCMIHHQGEEYCFFPCSQNHESMVRKEIPGKRSEDDDESEDWGEDEEDELDASWERNEEDFLGDD